MTRDTSTKLVEPAATNQRIRTPSVSGHIVTPMSKVTRGTGESDQSLLAY